MESQRKDLLQALTDLEVSKEQIRRQNEVLHELASRDGLTGALNRRALFEKTEALWPNRNQGDRGIITIMMDVDHFKKLNDQHGHAAGDSVLKDLVKTVRLTWLTILARCFTCGRTTSLKSWTACIWLVEEHIRGVDCL
jgi:PleD family two-component response regulator